MTIKCRILIEIVVNNKKFKSKRDAFRHYWFVIQWSNCYSIKIISNLQ
jgi:hypothetical protein